MLGEFFIARQDCFSIVKQHLRDSLGSPVYLKVERLIYDTSSSYDCVSFLLFRKRYETMFVFFKSVPICDNHQHNYLREKILESSCLQSRAHRFFRARHQYPRIFSQEISRDFVKIKEEKGRRDRGKRDFREQRLRDSRGGGGVTAVCGGEFGVVRARAHVSPFTHNDTRRVRAHVYAYVFARVVLSDALVFFSFLTKRSGHLQRVCLEPFTPCWVSHRNLLRPRLHPRGSRRENPSDLVAPEESP